MTDDLCKRLRVLSGASAFSDIKDVLIEAASTIEAQARDVAFWEKLSNANSDDADKWKSRAETAERQLAEAVKVIKRSKLTTIDPNVAAASRTFLASLSPEESRS